jgi:hypothetical protein
MADFKLSPDGLYVGANGVVFEDGFSVPGTYHTWRRDYSINNLNPTDLLYRDGSALPTGGAYRFSAHISGTGTDQSATAVYWNQNGTWKLNVVFQSGTSSNHPEFIIGANGNPQISIDHTSYYTINIYHEHMQLAEESTGTDNFGGFGADQYMSYVDGLRFNPSGSGTTWNQGYTVWHAGNDGSGSTLDADLLDGLHASDFLRSNTANNLVGAGAGLFVHNTTNATGATISFSDQSGGDQKGSITFYHSDAASPGSAYGSSFYISTNQPTGPAVVLDAAGNYFVGTNVVWHAGNDGSGSGLDADLLDGLQGSSYLRSDTDDTTTGILTTNQVRWGSGAGTYSGNPRSAVIGYSGGNYGQIGYGWIPTTTSGVHTSQINDLQSRIDLYNGIQVYGSGSAVAVGTNVTWTAVLDARTNTFTYKGNTIWHAANDGASSGLDADLLDGQHGSYYQNASNLTSGTVADARVSGTYSGITLKTDGGNTHFTTPNSGSNSTNDRTVFGLAQYKIDASNAVGAIVFTAPTTNSSIMHRMRIEGMLYVGGPTVMAVVQGYRTSGAWSNASKVNLGITDIQVRWGVDPTGKNCLILGDVGTTWSYPMMAITHAMFSHSGSNDAYCTGWTVGLVTSLTGYTNVTGTLSNTSITTNVTGNAGTATTLQTARTINGVSFNGSANITVEPYIEDDEATNATRYIVFTDNSTGGYKRLNEDSALNYNPSTNTLTAGVFVGDGSALTGIDAGAKNGIFWENGQNVTTSYTITNGKNAMSAGPITINSGVTVTVGAGETWTVV